MSVFVHINPFHWFEFIIVKFSIKKWMWKLFKNLRPVTARISIESIELKWFQLQPYFKFSPESNYYSISILLLCN